jgi:hypothetical protein
MSNDQDMSVWDGDREELVFYSKRCLSFFLWTRLELLERSIRSGVTHKFPKPDGGDFLALETVL